MIELSTTEQGVILPVRAQPRAKKSGVLHEHAGMLKVAVTAPPEVGKANEEIVKLLAKELRISPSSIRLLSGATHRHKKFLIAGIDVTTVRRWLNRKCGP